jgi:hypothetical protein
MILKGQENLDLTNPTLFFPDKEGVGKQMWTHNYQTWENQTDQSRTAGAQTPRIGCCKYMGYCVRIRGIQE